MAWTTPRTWVTGEVVTAALMNTHVRDNLEYLYDNKGPKEVWSSVTEENPDGITTLGDYPAGELQNGEYAAMSFITPADFTSITTAVICVIAQATQAAANWDIYSDYCAVGENYNAHSDSDTTSTYNVTNNQRYDVDVSGILGDLAAGDVCAVRLLVSSAGHDCAVLGFHMTYA